MNVELSHYEALLIAESNRIIEQDRLVDNEYLIDLLKRNKNSELVCLALIALTPVLRKTPAYLGLISKSLELNEDLNSKNLLKVRTQLSKNSDEFKEKYPFLIIKN